MRVVHFVVWLFVLSSVSGVAFARLDEQTKATLSGEWKLAPGQSDIKPRYGYVFEFTRNGALAFFDNGNDFAEWLDVTNAVRSGSDVTLNLRSLDGIAGPVIFSVTGDNQLAEHRDSGDILLVRAATSPWPTQNITKASIFYFSPFQPRTVVFVEPVSPLPDEQVCALSEYDRGQTLEVHLLWPEAPDFQYYGRHHNDFWSLARARTMSDGVSLEVALTRKTSAGEEIVHLERLSASRMRVREWKRTLVRCALLPPDDTDTD